MYRTLYYLYHNTINYITWEDFPSFYLSKFLNESIDNIFFYTLWVWGVLPYTNGAKYRSQQHKFDVIVLTMVVMGRATLDILETYR